MLRIAVILLIITFTLFSCAREEFINTNSPEEFRDSIENLISTNTHNLDKEKLRGVFTVALGTIDFASVPKYQIDEFANQTFAAFTNDMLDRAVGVFADIRDTHNKRLGQLNVKLDTSNSELLNLQQSMKAAIELDEQDIIDFKRLTSNIQEINSKISIKCKERPGSKRFELEISNKSNFDFYLGQVYVQGNDGSLTNSGMLVVNDTMYNVLERKSTMSIPESDIAIIALCRLNEAPLNVEVLTEIGDNDSLTFVGRDYWLPRRHSKSFRMMEKKSDNLISEIQKHENLIKDSNKMLYIADQGIKSVGVMQFQILSSELD